ncbi:MAG: hypothetical protein KGY65_02705 [Candidatus Thermoplasmatota archaeon]|nr:hypothetical protein [Candidatus Thermoplasmatota archaeon]
MKKKLIIIFIITNLSLTIIPGGIGETNNPPKDMSYMFPMKNDALIPPDSERIRQSTITSPEPGFYETSEYMIGSIAVAGIFLESNGAIDPDTELWTPVEELNVQTEFAYALTQWWESQNPHAQVDMNIEWHTNIPTSYEPIIHQSAITDNTYEQLWVKEAMAYLGFSSGDWMQRVRSFINDLRQRKGTDWAFAVFIIDSTNDFATDTSTPGSFADNYNAYAYTGGPFCVVTYNNGQWGITNMHKVIAHETGHIFWATEEYNHQIEYSGYLNEKETEGSGCLMDTNALCLSDGTKKQIGWRDTDGDNILDIIDTNPNTDIDAHIPDPTSEKTLTYEGIATVIPHPNTNPSPWDSGNDVTINIISQVKYNIDGGPWLNANPLDGTFDNAVEDFSFTIGPLSLGTHTITVRAVNSVGNTDTTPASDTVTIISGNTPPIKPNAPAGKTSGKINTEYSYSTSTTDPDGDDLYYLFDWGDETDSGWIGPHSSGEQVSAEHTWITKDDYQIKVKAKDEHSKESEWSDPLEVAMPKDKKYLPIGLIFAFGFDVDVKILQLEPGEDYVDLEVLSQPFYIWKNEVIARNPGEFIRLYNAKGLFSPSIPFCFGICDDWSIIG